jgi:dTDP-glucose 4,6-dehydratase
LRVLVTGGSGFIGSNLVRYLVHGGYEVLNLDKLTYAASGSSLQDLETHPRYRFVHADICDAEAVELALKSFAPEAIVHLAAESHVDRSIDAPGRFITTNVVGTYVLLDAARRFHGGLPDAAGERFRFIHVSTDEVFGSLGTSDPAFNESTAYDPRSPYSASKAGADHLVRAWWHTYGLPTIVTNCSNNYGPYQFPEKLIPTVILKCLRQEPVPVYGDGGNVRDWLYVEDHVRALERVLRQGRAGATYAIGGGNERTNLELVREICAIMDELVPRADAGRYADLIEFVVDRPGHDRRYAIDSTHARQDLDWEPMWSPYVALRETVRWYLDNGSWWEPILSHAHDMRRLGLSVPADKGKAQ